MKELDRPGMSNYHNRKVVHITKPGIYSLMSGVCKPVSNKKESFIGKDVYIVLGFNNPNDAPKTHKIDLKSPVAKCDPHATHLSLINQKSVVLSSLDCINSSFH